MVGVFFFCSSRRRHTRCSRDWSSDVCSSDLGDLEDFLPLLDRNVTIPLGTRRIAEYANLMTDELSKQTGLHIGCCQRLVAGVPWGMAKVRFEADNKPAREVLKWLILSEQQAMCNPVCLLSSSVIR